MPHAYICDAIRTPFGRYGGALATVRTDDLGAIPLRALVERNARVDWEAVDDVIFGPDVLGITGNQVLLPPELQQHSPWPLLDLGR